jgi:hypothetical protein
MPFIETRFISPTTLTTSAASALYTVPTGYSAIIKQFVVTNISASAATFTFYVNTASASNALFSGTSVAANDTVIINLSQVLTTGEILRALASTNSALNLTVSGVINDGPLASTATYIADNAITSAKIADGAIVNADINASAAIAVSKLANATAGQVLIGTTTTGVITPTTISGDVTVTGAGVTAIKSDVSLTGTPLAPTATAGTNTTQLATTAFANTAGGLVLLTSSSIPGASTSFSFTNFTSTYTNYQVKVRIDYVSNDCDLYLRYSTGAGPDAGSNYYSATLGLNDGGGSANSNQGGATFQTVGPLDSAQSASSFGHRSVTMEIFSPLEASRTEMTYSSWGYTQAGTGTYLSGGGCYNTGQVHTGFTMFTSNGTSIIGGTYQVYGYRK